MATKHPAAASDERVYLKDYRPPAYRVETISLRFELDEESTRVRAESQLQRAPSASAEPAPLVLNGQEVELISVQLDGRMLGPGDYQQTQSSLIIPSVPERFRLTIETRLRPQDNTSLSGLYKSGGAFCTQCEAEGFRRITYFLDRPDVMARYTVTLVADRERYPVLLSNGNLHAAGDTDAGRHFATWEDPFPKPSYLFAMVAGDLARVEDQFVTQSGRQVHLHMYVERHNADKCAHAMQALKRAMRWDEEVYGREYDLDIYMIVAVDDFNMGAMENKGLNIFNSKYVLASAATATDADFQAIESIIGHEYFHNWSGNRVTCRDWFQLSLKEGFTVFRDQEFSADIHSRGVKRIQDANYLRNYQFREDAGPMAHPVRPESYVAIDNFYTTTVYQKGAEVVRMIRLLLGPEAFRRGTDLYFARHDGQAVTTEDFVKAMEDASGKDLHQFRLWYSQAGTPELEVDGQYDAPAKAYTLRVRQRCPVTPGQPNKAPMHIPLAVGLLSRGGQDLPLQLESPHGALHGNVLSVTATEQSFRFCDVPELPVPSLLRGFSAPVRLRTTLGDDELYFLMAHDSDAFNRWEAAQTLAVKNILALASALQSGETASLDPRFSAAWGRTLLDATLDSAFAAEVLTLPAESYIGEFMEPIDPTAIHQAWRAARRQLAENHRANLLEVYERNVEHGSFSTDASAVGKRRLKNLSLSMLSELDSAAERARCVVQFEEARNMTDTLAALSCLANHEGPERGAALRRFEERWHDDPLVMDKWLAVQATSRLPGTLEHVKALTAHPAFNIKNPNRVRSLVGAFANLNPVNFHRPDGAGYAFVADQILIIDEFNPQLAARLANAFMLWRKFDAARQRLMTGQLQRIQSAHPSRDLGEIVNTALKAA